MRCGSPGLPGVVPWALFRGPLGGRRTKARKPSPDAGSGPLGCGPRCLVVVVKNFRNWAIREEDSQIIAMNPTVEFSREPLFSRILTFETGKCLLSFLRAFPKNWPYPHV